MNIYNSTTFSSESNLSITVIYGTKSILEVHHSDDNIIHQVILVPIVEWSSKNKTFHSISVASSFTILPSSLAFNESNALANANLDIKNGLQKTIISEFTILFDGIPTIENQVTLSQSHLNSKMIEKSISLANKNDILLSIGIWDGNISLCLIENGQLKNCNHYSSNDLSEALYYTMLYVQEYDLYPETLDCQLFGDTDKTGTFASKIIDYIRNVNVNRMGIVPQTDIDGMLSLIFG